MRATLLLMMLTFAAPNRVPSGMTLPPPKAPTQNIVGDWIDERINDNKMLRISPGETLFIMNGRPSPTDGLTANILIDWSKNPAHIDFMPKSRGGKMLGLLKLEGDRLTLAIQTSGTTRPSDFGNGNLLIHYRRGK